MKKMILVFCCLLGMSSECLFATVYTFEFSPSAGDALFSTNYANGDHALGITALNAVGQPASLGTGGVIGGGVTFDDTTGLLAYEIGYGSDFGFNDLAGSFSVAHIHGPVAVQFPLGNTGAGVVAGLLHTPGSSSTTGSFTGSAALTAPQQADLLANLYYVNIHSSFAGGGEIRGQLVATGVVPEPSMLAGLAATGGAFLCQRRRRFRRR